MKKKMVLAMLAVMTTLVVTGCTAKTPTEEVKEPAESADVVTVEPVEEEQEEEAVAEEGVLAISTPEEILTQYDDDGNCQLYYKTQGIKILNEGYDELQAALDKYSTDSYNELNTAFEQAKSEYGESGIAGEEWSMERTVDMNRADSKVVSFVMSESTYLGGAHPSYYLIGSTYDSQTGAELSLKDVVTDYDKVYEYVLDYLSNYEYADEFFEEWQDTVKSEFYDDDVFLSWAMNNDGIEICFNTYDIAPYAMGPVFVDITLADNSDLLNGDYFTEEKAQLCQKMITYVDYDVDVDGDGTLEKVRVQEIDDYANDDSFELEVVVTKDGTESTITRDEEIAFGSAYLVQNESGKTYVYADISYYNDYHIIDVFDVSDVNEGPSYVGSADNGAVYDGMLADAAHMPLITRLDVFGTHSAYADFSVGEDGMPVINDGVYKYINYNQENLFNGGSSMEAEYYLTLKTDIEAEVADNASLSGASNETLAVGTKLYPYATDNSSYVIFKLDDGRFAKVSYVHNEEDVYATVNGLSEEEVFDGIQYAG